MAQVVDLKSMIPIGYEEALDKKSSVGLVKFYSKLPDYVIARGLALVLGYPRDTRIERPLSCGLYDPSIQIIRPKSFSEDLMLRFPPSRVEVWVRQGMQKEASEQYKKFVLFGSKLDEEIGNCEDCPPKFWDSPDYFRDSVSPRMERTFFNLSSWEQAAIIDSRMAF